MTSLWLAAVLTGLAATADAPRWLDDYGRARTLARQTGRPIFVVFRCEH